MKTSIIVSTLALCSCGHATGSFLPNVKGYSPEFQKQLKAELPKVRECCPNTNEFVKDSIKLRDKVRAGQDIQNQQGGQGLFKKFFRRKQ